MKIIIPILICFPLMSCAGMTMNPYGILEDDSAYLENTIEQTGKTQYKYYFNNATTSAGTKSFYRIDLAKIMIPAGELLVGVTIRYYYKGTYEDLSFKQQLKVELMDWELFESKAIASYYHDGIGIHVFNNEDAWAIKDLKGIKFNALQGEIYRTNSSIENGKAFIWIEDSKGVKVSETYRGYAWALEIWRPERSEDYWLWETLPDPVN